MRYIKFIIAALPLAITLFATSCSKEKDETNRMVQERILDAYIEMYYPSAHKYPSGLTILEMTEGTGSTPEDYSGCYIHYSTYTLDGVCQSTTDSLKAKELGTYSASTYYGPVLFIMSKYYTTEGMYELLKSLKKGSKVKAIIPPWLTMTSSSGKNQQSTINILYEITVTDIVTQPLKYQIDSLESYIKMNFSPKIDSTNNGFYFRNFTHPSGIADKDTIKENTKVNVWYIGRLLDGYIFDTNIADTAKKYRIYDASNTYSALSATILSSAELMKESTNAGNTTTATSTSNTSSLILGFCKALKGMTYGDRAVTLFTSGYGYGETGNMSNGSGVPWYSPLRFDIWLTYEKDTDYPPIGFTE